MTSLSEASGRQISVEEVKPITIERMGAACGAIFALPFLGEMAGVDALAGCQEPKTNAAFDRYRQPEKLIASLHLETGAAVADVGAGRGYLTHRLAAAVGPRGRVVATDIDFAALQQIGVAKSGEAPIEIRKVAAGRSLARGEGVRSHFVVGGRSVSLRSRGLISRGSRARSSRAVGSRSPTAASIALRWSKRRNVPS